MEETYSGGAAVALHFLMDDMEKSKDKKRRKLGETRNLQKNPPTDSLQLCPTQANDKAEVTPAWRGP